MVVKNSPVYLYNSLSKEKEAFAALNPKFVGVYTCGPTVYDYVHIGNMRSYVFADILVRTLNYNGYTVRHIENITDVGHLTSDADEGEDKIEKRARQEGISAADITKKYIDQFLKDAILLNLLTPQEQPRASDHIQEQIDIIANLEKKGYTYRISDGIYFDTDKLEDYTQFGLIKDTSNTQGRITEKTEKKNPQDFALWKFSPKETKRQQEWDSPWGIGFPGWHIECSAMSNKYLGFPIDIHTGGVDHKSIHHTNEIAQNKIFFGKRAVNYWLHNDFLVVDGKKMAKSLANLHTLTDIIEKDFHPLALRYLYLQTHYRHILQFTWEALGNAAQSYKNLEDHVNRLLLQNNSPRGLVYRIGNFFRARPIESYWKKKFLNAINDDLNTPQALAVVWELIKNENISSHTKLSLLRSYDDVLGLGLSFEKTDIPEHIMKLAEDRDRFREQKDWDKADKIRTEIEKAGFLLEDTDEGARIIKK